MTGRFDARTSTYDEGAAHRWQAELAAELCDAQPSDRVIATGAVLLLRALPPVEGDGLRVGIDLSTEMLRAANAALPGATWIAGDAARCRWTTRPYLVTCVADVPYLAGAGVAFAEWHRVLRPV